MTRVAVLDYGMGNLRSVEKALERVGAEPLRTGELDRAADADGLILPGVGAFPRAMERLRQEGMDRFVRDWVDAERPLLGICLGMQLLFERSSELGGAVGLGLLGGEVTQLAAGAGKLPHIGWEPVRWERPSRLAPDAGVDSVYYFVHSFVPRPSDPEDVVATAQHGERFAAIVERGRVFGAQFHPEKSSRAGLRLLAGFVDACAPAAV